MALKIMGEGFAAVSWIAGAASAMPMADESLLNWLTKLLLGVAIAIIGYFVKKVAKQIEDNQDQLAQHDAILTKHKLLVNHWIGEAKRGLSNHDGNVGRRSSDTALVHLLEAIEAMGGEEK